MAKRQYKVIREVHDQSRFLSTIASEYPGFRMYLVEAPSSDPYSRANQYMLSRESFVMGQSLMIDDDIEITMLKGNGPAYLSLNGNRVIAYRPERSMASEFRIVSEVKDAQDIERFGRGIDIHRSHYRLYNAVREGANGYNGTLVRIFVDANDAAYGRGMGIPINETIALPPRSGGTEPPHYLHDMTSKAYRDRVWKAIRRASGATNP